MATMNQLTKTYGKIGGLVLKNGVRIFTGSGAPTDGTTGAGKAGPGSVYIDYTNKVHYINNGTKASPTWVPGSGGGGDALREVYNGTGGALAVNTLVAISGWDATTNLPKVVAADADSASLLRADYVLPAAIADGASGLARQTFRSAANLNTNAASAVGDPVYLSTAAGGWTLSAPATADDLQQVVGRVAVKSATVGVIEFDLRQPQMVGTNQIQDDAVTDAKIANAPAAGGTQEANKFIKTDANINQGVVKATELHIGATGAETQVTATPAELNTLDRTGAAGVAEASKAVVLDANKHLDEVNTAALKLGATGATTEVTATAAELNKLDRVGADGAAEASKAVVLDANAHVDAVKTAALHIGASGAEVQVTLTPAQMNVLVSTINSLRSYVADGMLQIGTLAISAVPEKFKTTTETIYRIGGLPYTKVATDNLVFSAADTINTGAAAGDYWGVWLVQVDAAGTVSTKSPAADQVYASEAAAIAALPTVDANNIQLGYITVEANNGTDWVANTDDMTPASDCQAANFYDLPAPATLPAAIA